MMPALEEEFFNLLETSESRWTNLLVEGRTWIDVEVQNLAWQSQIDRRKANGAHYAQLQRFDFVTNNVYETATVVEPVVYDQTWRLWASPQRRRATFVVGNGIVDVIIEGSTFWSNGPDRSFTNGGKKNMGHGQGDGQNLIDTAEYAPLLQVAEISEGMKYGRRTIDARVTIVQNEHPPNRQVRGRGVHGLTIGDPEFLELSVDRERGVVLSASSWFQASLYRIVEVTRCEFDLVFSRDAFEIEPKFGVDWSSV
jgi:hypothetical protein